LTGTWHSLTLVLIASKPRGVVRMESSPIREKARKDEDD